MNEQSHYAIILVMNKIDLSLLNPSQMSALSQIDGPIMVLAGAGSGKTRLVTYRIAHLIVDLGVSPENILAITFTNKAAGEMKERLLGLLGSQAEDIWISTFHSMCVKILRRHISSLKSSQNAFFDGNFSIYSDSDKEKALKNVLESLKLEGDNLVNTMSYHISNAKNKNLSPWEYQKYNQDIENIDDIVRVYSAYQNYLSSNNSLDFDDLLVKTYELFKEFPDILHRYRTKFQYIHIDEFQDTNGVQYAIASMLAKESRNIFVVGDEDQCIYSWRGANIQNIKSFAKDFPEYKIFKLEQNYRSTKQILNVANKVISNNESRNDKTLWTENDVGTKVEVYKAQDEFDEAEYVASRISYLVREYGYKYSDFAVLSRLNALSASFEEKFLNYNIPYKVFGASKFFDRLEIKNIISYLKMMTNPYDSTSFSRIINYPKRGIGDATIGNVLQLAQFHNTTPYNLILNSEEYLLDAALERRVAPFKQVLMSLNEAMEALDGYELIEKVVKLIDFKSIYSTGSEEDMSRLLNVDNFLVMAQEYFKNNPRSSCSEFLQSITLYSDIDDYDDENNTVTLATVHAVKGLEFRCVFVVGLEEKLFPIVRTYSSSSDMEEERRLMFVAVTRAKERLSLSYAKSRFLYGKRDYLIPSRFLRETGLIETPVEDRRSFSEMSQYGSYSSYGQSSYGGNSYNQSSYGQSSYNQSSYGQSSFSQSSFASKPKQSFSIPKFETSKDKKLAEDLATKYAVGKKVTHPKFGGGVISSNEGIGITKCVSIDFEGVGRKTLSVEYAPITLVD